MVSDIILLLNLNRNHFRFSFSSYDEYGFLRGEDFDAASHQEFMSSYLPVLVRRGQRWEAAYTAGEEKNARLKRFIRKGIPNRCDDR